DYQATLRRTLTVASMRYSLFGYKTPAVGFYGPVAKKLVQLARKPGLSWRERLFWARYNYRCQRALRDGLRIFHQAVVTGGERLQELGRAYCGPMPLRFHSVQTESIE